MGVTVNSIDWQATYLRFGCSEDDGELYLYRIKNDCFVPLQRVVDADGRVYFETNLVNALGREILGSGEWILCQRIPTEELASLETLLAARPHLRLRLENEARSKIKRSLPDSLQQDPRALERAVAERLEENIAAFGLERIRTAPYDHHYVKVTSDLLANLAEHNRIFRYGGKVFAYTAVFAARVGSSGEMYLFMDIQFFRKVANPRDRGTRKAKLKRRIHQAYDILSKLARRNGKHILFLKQNGEKPTENMQALIDRMTERGMFDPQVPGGGYTKSIYCHNVFRENQNLLAWIRDLREIARADYVFVDDYVPIFNAMDLDADQTLVQLWHAGVGFKSVGYARFGLNGSPDPYSSCHRKYTYALCGNADLRVIYSEVFGIEKSALLATGMPRLDHFLDEDRIAAKRCELASRFPWLEQGCTIVFAPTYRGTGQKQAFYPYDLLDFEAIYQMCRETGSHFVFKMHGFILEPPPIPEEMRDLIHDLSTENLNDLYYQTDVLITDYSSCFYDFLLLKKPVIFYMPDKTEYEVTRGVQRPIDGFAPGLVIEDFAGLIQTLHDGDYDTVEPPAMVIDRAVEGDMLNSDRVIDTIIYGKNTPGVKLEK